MIQRPSASVVIEGPVVPELDAAPPCAAHPRANATVRQRLEIDLATGCFTRVDPVPATPDRRSPPDLALDDSYIIFPGFIDAHVHAREDVSGRDTHKESFETAGEAAIHGGITAFVEMPNNPIPPRDAASYAAKKALAARSRARVLLYAIVGEDTEPMATPAPYKAYMAESIGKFHFSDERTLRRVLPRYHGQFVAFHAEHPQVLLDHRNGASHFDRRPPAAEVAAIELALELCAANRIEAHICHLSTAEGLDRIRRARARGEQVTTEVTPHHLYYDQSNASMFSRPEYLQCNPPIRTREDRAALLEGLRAGEIGFLATDHAPHTIDEKDRGISGVTHLDTYGNFVFWLLQQGLTLQDIRRVSCENPGRFISRFLEERFGRIAPGYVGSLTILERTPTTIRRESLRTRAGWSVFEGQTFPGRVSHTVVRGQIYPQAD